MCGLQKARVQMLLFLLFHFFYKKKHIHVLSNGIGALLEFRLPKWKFVFIICSYRFRWNICIYWCVLY